jgi:hypothetical protein
MYSTTRKIIAIAALAVLVTIGFMFIELEIKRGRTLNDSPIVLTGTARNAQAGAVLETATSIIYLDNVPSWPTDLEGKKVTATGKLVEKKYIPDPSADPNLPSTGASGNQQVLENPTWKIAE